MNILRIHYKLPFSFNDVVHPEISVSFSFRSFSSKHHKIIVITKHHMTSSRLRYLTIILHLLPRVCCLLVLIQIIQECLLLPNEVSSSKYPYSVNRVLTRCVVFSWNKPVGGRFYTYYLKCLDWVETSFDKSFEGANLVFYFELNS